MTADGNWKLTMNTPIGARTMTLSINSSGQTFSGKIESEMGSRDIAGTIDGDTLTWSTEIPKPMPMTLEFTVTVAGDAMTGQCKLGMFGTASVTGERL